MSKPPRKNNYWLSKVEKMSTEELKELADKVTDCLIVRNLSAVQAQQELLISDDALRYVQRQFNIRKTRKQITETMQRTNVEKFGTPHYSVARGDRLTVWQFDQLSDAEKRQIVEKYEAIHLVQNRSPEYAASELGISDELGMHIRKNYSRPKTEAEIAEYKRLNSLNRYGVDHPSKSEEVKSKVRETCLEKFGVTNYFQTEECKAANEAACLARYGTSNPFQSKLFQSQARETMKSRYGVEYTAQSRELREKMKSTSLERYGNEYYHASDEGRSHMQYVQLKSKGNSDEAIRTLMSEDLLKKFILSMPEDERYIYAIARSLNCDPNTLYLYIHKYYNLSDIVYQHSGGYCHSFIEDEIFEFVSSICDAQRGCRSLISPQEVDIYIPSAKLAIEVNGIYWHSDKFGRGSHYHQDKSLKVADTGNFLFHIFEYEWKIPRCRQIIESQLVNLIGNNSHRIYARNCRVSQISVSECRKFLEDNHLQGFRNASIYLGLFYNSELVSVLTLGRPYFSKEFEWEIYRFCGKINTSVIGGFGKLFTYFIRNYNPSSVMTFSDCAKGTGDVYNKFGFVKLSQTEPNYVWAKESDYRTRYQCQMKGEREYMESKGYLRVYDCGNYKWAWYGDSIERPKS